MSVAVVTDSSCQLPAEWVDAFGVHVIDLHTTVDDGEIAATSALNPDELGNAYEQILHDTDVSGIVSLHVSGKLSRTWASAIEAAERFGGRVHVVDSQNVGMVIGAAAAQAAHLARQGANLGAVSELATNLTRRSATWFSVDKMDSLRRGGRVGAAFALFGGALSTKPVLKIANGNLSLAGKTRTVTKALARLRALAREELDRADALIAVQYSGQRDTAEELAWEFRKETMHPDRVLVMELEPVLAWHAGDHAVAVSVCPLEFPDFPIPTLATPS